MLTPKQFNYAFTNTLGPAEAAEIYARLAIPGPARPLFQAAFANINPNAVTKVNYMNDDRAPLLLIAAGKDNVIPVSVSKAAVKRHSKSKAKTVLEVYPDRGHEIVGEPGWEEVADRALDWAEQNALK